MGGSVEGSRERELRVGRLRSRAGGRMLGRFLLRARLEVHAREGDLAELSVGPVARVRAVWVMAGVKTEKAMVSA